MGKAPQDVKKKQDFKSPISPLWLGRFSIYFHPEKQLPPVTPSGGNWANEVHSGARIRGFWGVDIRVIESHFSPVRSQGGMANTMGRGGLLQYMMNIRR
jgi:hypothetical protein